MSFVHDPSATHDRQHSAVTHAALCLLIDNVQLNERWTRLVTHAWMATCLEWVISRSGARTHGHGGQGQGQCMCTWRYRCPADLGTMKNNNKKGGATIMQQ